ncbi:ATP-dependent DNA helicase RecQ [Candidatus Saccharibacteria bacterium]|nr:ATP-dependent DNA helicase RecQ [Candidatus Saccharibacteria bacterium]
METIKELIISKINSLSEPNTVVVLKGFNKWLSEVEGDFIFGKEIEFKKPETKDLLQKLVAETGVMFAVYEDLIALSYLSLGGIFKAAGKKVYILENDFYTTFYPSNFTAKEYEKVKEWHDADHDEYIQQLYGSIEQYKDNVYIAYNDLPDGNDIETMAISEMIDGSVVEDSNEEAAVIPDEYDLVVLSEILTEVIESGVGKVSVLDDSLVNDKNIVALKGKLERAGVKMISRSYRANANKVKPEFYIEYLQILHRKNPEYGFRNLKLYKNPYESNELVEVEQSIIIDDIVQNAIRAHEQELFRDVFVTAPTGAGKSVMFQIPAIYLAEKYNLVTLVISPLIGLMNDQVQNIKTMTDVAAAINSDYTPIEKENTLEAIKNGSKSILYLSPEALLSNTDITSLIGDRKIGLIVVDEAHIVATWGKSFRPDYWYLGEFINRLRNGNKSEYQFPIVTFTATSTFGGDDNMYHDIIESLKMTPNKYIGNVRREDIGFDIKCYKKDHAYREEKLEKATESIDKLMETGEKTLVYVPYTKHVNDLLYRIKEPEKAGRYYGGMPAGEKNETLKCISEGSKNVVIATKAFGMGIDIDDIKYVYHFAPTGNIADYVQEIGRAARKPGMHGVASTDFFPEDFRYIRQLYGMSSIKNFQIVAMLRKIYQLYTAYGKRNFLVSPEDFAFIFADTPPDGIDAKIKTTLLMIRKDFESDMNTNYPPVVFKPRSMFTVGYFMVNDEMLVGLKQFGYLKYFKKLDLPRSFTQATKTERASDVKVSVPGDIYRLDYRRLWENHYRDISFGMFKYLFFKNELKDFNFRVGEKIITRIILDVDAGRRTLEEVQQDLMIFLDGMMEVLSGLKQAGKYFSTGELAEMLVKKGLVKKKYIADVVAGAFIPMLERVKPYRNSLFANNFSDYNSKYDKTLIRSVSYEPRINNLKAAIRRFIFGDQHKTSRYVSSKENVDVVVVQLIEMLELAHCNTTAGENPEFFIRVNNAYAIERVMNNPNYVSRTVASVARKHGESCVLMQHFFAGMDTDQARWDYIERYFLGQITRDEIEQLKKAQQTDK